MKKVECKITGLSPLLMHRYPLEPVEALEKRTPQEQAEIAAYRDPGNRELYVPGTALQRALVGGATFSKGKGRGSLAKAAAAGLFVEEMQLGLGTDEFTLDSRAVVMPATRGRVVRHRPRVDDWTLRFTLSYDETLLSAKQVREIVDHAGQRVGLLDFRPERKGPFGRFRVDEWREVA